jgi:hypothetical protein
MDIHYNAGVTSTNLIGDLPRYGPVWYHPNGLIANITSLAQMKERNGVTFDSDDGNRFTIHKEDGSTRDFRESKKGLYYLDTSVSAVTLTINTVDDNKSRYTNHNYSRALLARKIQDTIGRPSMASYIHIVDNNLMRNCAQCHVRMSLQPMTSWDLIWGHRRERLPDRAPPMCETRRRPSRFK